MEFYNQHLKVINSIASSNIQLVVIPVKTYFSLEMLILQYILFLLKAYPRVTEPIKYVESHKAQWKHKSSKPRKNTIRFEFAYVVFRITGLFENSSWQWHPFPWPHLPSVSWSPWNDVYYILKNVGWFAWFARRQSSIWLRRLGLGSVWVPAALDTDL